jgi:L-threonate 2-dehydrogenase
MKDTIAVIGLGIMGAAMANNLRNGKLNVLGYDVSENARASFSAAGGEVAIDLESAVREARLVLISLPSALALRSVVASLVDCITEGTIIIETSTLSVADKEGAREACAAVGATLLDCPVSGTGPQAASGDLTVFGSGNPEAFECARPALELIAREVLYLGNFGSGSTLKFIANHLVTIHNAATAEALVLAKRAGLDTHKVFEALKNSAATSRMFQVRGPMIVEGNYEPAMRIATYQKDLDIIGTFAKNLRCPTPLFDVCAQLYLAAQSQGHGERDTAAVALVLESLAGLS